MESQNEDRLLRYEDELDLNLPKHFDAAAASVYIRGVDNDPTNGFDISLRSTFGKQTIEIFTDDYNDSNERTVIEAELEIYEADIVFETKNCRIAEQHEIPVDDGGDAFKVQENLNQSDERSNRSTRGVDLTAELNSKELTNLPGANISAEYSAGRSGEIITARRIKAERRQRTAYFTSNDTLHIRGIELDNFRGALDGIIINGVKACHIRPDSNNDPCVVLAWLRVRRPWIKLYNVSVRKPLNGFLSEAGHPH